MVAFLDCVQQFKEEVEKGDTGFCLPYRWDTCRPALCELFALRLTHQGLTAAMEVFMKFECKLEAITSSHSEEAGELSAFIILLRQIKRHLVGLGLITSSMF